MGSEKKDVTGRRQFLVVPLTLKLLKRTMHIDNLSSATNRSLPGTHHRGPIHRIWTHPVLCAPNVLRQSRFDRRAWENRTRTLLPRQVVRTSQTCRGFSTGTALLLACRSRSTCSRSVWALGSRTRTPALAMRALALRTTLVGTFAQNSKSYGDFGSPRFLNLYSG